MDELDYSSIFVLSDTTFLSGSVFGAGVPRA